MSEIPAPSVLLLEDDAADALLLEEALERSLPQVDVVRAGNRREYLERLAAGRADLVLSDGSIPGCEGLDAFRLAREHLPSVPFIVISGQVHDRDLRELRGAGINGVLSKDRLDDLGPAVRDALGGHDPELNVVRLRIGYESLLVTARQLAQAADRAAIWAISCAAAVRLTGSDGATFVVREGDECRHVAESPAERRLTDRRFHVEDCISGWTMRRRRPAVVDDLDADPRMTGPAGTDFRAGLVRSVVVVPVGAEQPRAAISAYWTQPHPPDLTDVRLMQALADTVAVAIIGADHRDALKGLVRDRTAELDGLSYAVSHDLRAPIRHLSGFTRILSMDAADLSEETRHVANRISDAATQLREMVDGLLALSRTSRAEVDRQPVDLAELARGVAERLTHDARELGPSASVEFVVPEKLPVSGDPRLLTELLRHLLDNGWKFTARVPRPRVELGVQPGWPAEQSSAGSDSSDSSDGPVYFIRDNGAGFEAGSHGRLFGAFQRLHGVDEFPGTGLGLATAQRIIAKHGGTIRGLGVPDHGATFLFTLPARPDR